MLEPVPTAFLSYSHEDSEFALRLARDLKAAGVRIWLDQFDIRLGRPWDNAIEEALMAVPHVLLVLSPSSAKSENVRDEIGFALEHGKMVIPVLYRDCVVPLRLQRTQRVDFRADYAHGLSALLEHLSVTQSDDSRFSRRATTLRQWWIGGTAAALLVIIAAFMAKREWVVPQPAPASAPAPQSQARTSHLTREEPDPNRPVKDKAVAGNQWKAIKAADIPNLYSIFGTPDGKRLWTAGRSAAILQSEDGGATWQPRESGAKIPLEWIFATAEGNHVWTFDGRILQSDDGGTTWLARENAAGEEVLSMFGTVDGVHLWMAGGAWRFGRQHDGHGTLAQSRDGGLTWQVQKNIGDGVLVSIFGAADGKHLWTVNQWGTILQSDDSGSTWQTQKSLPDAQLSRIFCTPDGQHVWAVGGRSTTFGDKAAGTAGVPGSGTVVQSDDGGITWRVQNNVGTDRLNSLVGTANGEHLWALGGDSVLQSDDGGATWRAQELGADHLNSIFVTADGRHLWVASGDGTILQSHAQNP